MTAKILLGTVVLVAIAGSPIAYNHFTSSTGGTQQESETIPQEERRLVSSQTPEEQPRVPEVKIEKPQTDEAPAKVPPATPHEARENNPQVNEASAPAKVDTEEKDPKKNDECKLEGTTTWTGIGALDPRMKCVRGTIASKRNPA